MTFTPSGYAVMYYQLDHRRMIAFRAIHHMYQVQARSYGIYIGDELFPPRSLMQVTDYGITMWIAKKLYGMWIKHEGEQYQP